MAQHENDFDRASFTFACNLLSRCRRGICNREPYNVTSLQDEADFTVFFVFFFGLIASAQPDLTGSSPAMCGPSVLDTS